MHSTDRLKKITGLTSNIIAIVIAIAVPLGYFVTAFSYESRMLQKQANISADSLSAIAYMHPSNWKYQERRLEEIILSAVWFREDINYHVFDNTSEELVAINTLDAPPMISQVSNISDGLVTVGNLETQMSLRSLISSTLFIAAVALVVAFLVHYVLRVLPFAALARTVNSLQESQQRLIKEVDAKKLALSEQQRLSEELRHQATHDTLTGLPNRAYFNQAFTQALEKAVLSHANVSVMIIDLNRFKDINDTLGHHVGDRVLITTSNHIRRVLPDSSFLARLGGDEFAIFIPDSDTPKATTQVKSVGEALKSHMVIDSYHLAIHASIGVASFPIHGDNAETLLRHADVAMYHAKQNAEDYCIYDNSYDENSPNRLTLSADLRNAIDHDGLTLMYQPKIDFSNGEVIGVEALSRWEHPQHGFISPEVFISLAEQSGTINALTTWVIETALTQLSQWHSAGIKLNMAINISARNLQNENLLIQLGELIQRHDIPPHLVNLEITESSMMIDPAKSRELINKISQMGIQISVDDFGTGYSSLAYLKKLTVHELKIDRSFVMNMLNEPDDQVIVQSTIDLAHNLNLKIVAEGVEDQASYDLLKEYGCDFAQGFHICRPVSTALIEELVGQQNAPDIRFSKCQTNR